MKDDWSENDDNLFHCDDLLNIAIITIREK